MGLGDRTENKNNIKKYQNWNYYTYSIDMYFYGNEIKKGNKKIIQKGKNINEAL